MSPASQSPQPTQQESAPPLPITRAGHGKRSMGASAGLHLLVLGALAGWIPFVPHAARGEAEHRPATRMIPFSQPPRDEVELAPDPVEDLPSLVEEAATVEFPPEGLFVVPITEARSVFPNEDAPEPSPPNQYPPVSADLFAAVSLDLLLSAPPSSTPPPAPPSKPIEPAADTASGSEANPTAPMEILGSCEAPRYPVWAARAKITAEVQLAITVGKDGQVRAVEIISSTGHRALIEQAARAVWSWRYHPAMHNGEAVEDVVQKTIRYVP